MTDVTTHLAGKHSCQQYRDGDTETAEPRLVTCLRCRWNAAARAAEILGPERVPFVARVFGWLPRRAA